MSDQRVIEASYIAFSISVIKFTGFYEANRIIQFLFHFLCIFTFSFIWVSELKKFKCIFEFWVLDPSYWLSRGVLILFGICKRFS